MGYVTNPEPLSAAPISDLDNESWEEPVQERASGAARGKTHPSSAAGSTDDERNLLPLYLREMGSVSLLDKDEELELSKAYHDARAGLVEVSRELPEEMRAVVLGSRRERLERESHWMMDDIRHFVERVRQNDDMLNDRLRENVLQRIARHKAELDKARDALIVANLRLVVHMAKRFTRAGLSFLDLIQEGNIGLMKAVEKFEYKRGNKFSTYAYWWIKQAIDRAIAEKARMIRIPVNLNETRKRVRRTSRALNQALGRDPTPDEIARKMDLPKEKIEQVMNLVKDPQSLEIQRGQGDEPVVMQIADPAESASPVNNAEGRQVKTEIARALETLPPREKRILRLRYGIGGEGPYTLEEIGFFMNLSRERVRQLEYLGLRALQRSGILSELMYAIESP